MKKGLLNCMWLLSMLFSTIMTFGQTSIPEPTKGVMRVKLQPEVATQLSMRPIPMSSGIITTGIEPFDRASKQVKAVSMERVFPYSEKMEEKARKHGLDLWYEIHFSESINPIEATQVFKNVPGVTIAENIIPMQLIEGDKGFIRVSESQKQALSTRALTMPFNDPLLSKQWHYQNDGSMAGSIAGADINLFNAWKVATGNKELIVAIIDGGIDYKHVDLSDNVYINEKELNGIEGVDDDNNGFIDDIYGYNFVLNSGDVYAHSHGTHVAGTVGAMNNNGIGVSGIAGGNGQGGVKMLSCQVFDSRASNLGADYAKAFYYAAGQGAVIAQCSWGWDTSDYYEQAVLDAIRFFTEEAESPFMKGGLCIFANGNTGLEGNFYPACMDEVVAVGSMTYDLKPASYSSYGTWTDVTAPGGDTSFNSAQGVLSTLPNDEYGYSQGTSMACPHVSGIAALVLSKYGTATYSNESLRQQLITSVDDFYTSNPSVEGKYGTGYINAEKSMQMGNGNAPTAVDNIKLMAGQDNITLEWKIPATEDNIVYYHVLYYSKESFTATDDLSKLSQKRIDTKFLNSGDVMTYELSGLLPTTTYYIALKASDRWSNLSELSPIVEATTNKGPKMELDKTMLMLNLDASTSPVAKESFIIKNTDEGVLKWESFARTVSIYPSSLQNPIPGQVVTQQGDMSIIPHSNHTIVTSDYIKEDYPVEINYTESLDLYIGETDVTQTNSMAQWFYIDPIEFPNGFNLTDLFYQSGQGKNPTIEIYDGSTTIAKANLISKVEYDYFGYSWDIALKEQLFFAPGESFWVVTHFPAGQSYPLASGSVAKSTYNAYSYYSSNLGQTWSRISEILKDGEYAPIADTQGWIITAKSKNPDWSTVLTLDPAKGSVKPNKEQVVTVSNDGQKLVNGSYTFNLKLLTNEAENNEKVIPIYFNVSGNAPKLKTAQMVNFGDLLLGQSKTLTIEVVNQGYGVFSLPYQQGIICNSDQFEMPGYVQSFASRSTSSFNITFKPTTVGSHTGTVTLKTNTGLTHTFIVRGIAEEPARIEVDNNSFDVGNIEIGGESKEIKFNISNKGKFPLAYVLSKFSEEVIETAGATHKFGYSYRSNLKGSTDFAYDNNPDLINATDITSEFNDQNKWSKAINVGFDFPYYGTYYNEIYVSSYGAVAMSDKGAIHVCGIPTAEPSCVKELGLISAYGIGAMKTNENTRIEYARQDGKFVIKFVNALAADTKQSYIPISFHIVLSSNGDVEMHYDDYIPSLVSTNGTGIFVGLNDFKVLDPITVTDYSTYENTNIYQYIGTGSAIKFYAPGKSMITSINAPYGYIAIGESKEIIATIQATQGMYAGALENDLVIVSSDPDQEVTLVNIKANIIGESLKPVATIENTVIDFGTVFRTSLSKAIATIKNEGTDKLTVTNISILGNKVNHSQEVPFVIEPGSSKDVVLTMPTEVEGSITDEVTFTFVDNSTLSATLKGTVIGAPEIELNMAEIKETIESGSKLSKQLVVNNKGNEPLMFSLAPNNFISLTDIVSDHNSTINYAYKASVDYSDIEFKWIDIETTGEGKQYTLTNYLNHDYVTVDLPYDITFYGKSYKKMNIYGVGFVSFNEMEDFKEVPNPPVSLPTDKVLYTNIIAPYWGVHFMSQRTEAGVFYATREDCVIVSFMDYGNSLNNGVCFQVIIRKDGSFKYQYKLLEPTSFFRALYGVCGIQNNGATEGFSLAERCIGAEKAIEFYPVRNATLAPSTSKTIDFSIDTDKLAGNYQTKLMINTNEPNANKVEIPINLTITGEAKPIYPTEIVEESVIGVCSASRTVDVYFEIANHGTAIYKIKDITAEGLVGSSTLGTLQYYGYYSNMWGSGYQYIPYQQGKELEVGKEAVKFKVQMRNYTTVADYNIPLIFTVEGCDKEVIEIPFRLSITPAPSITFDKAEIHVKGVSESYNDNIDLVISNVGEYKLKYSLEIDAIGENKTSVKTYDAISGRNMNLLEVEHADKVSTYLSEVSTIKATATRADEINLDIPQGFEFLRSMYYPMFPNNTRLYFIGSGNKTSEFVSGTQFTAPADGFNLSHVYFYATIGYLKNVDIKAEVIQGNDISSDAIIGKGTLHVESEEPKTDGAGNLVYNGGFKILALDKPVYINPNETFYIRFTFPAGYELSIGIVPKEEAVVANRYMHYVPNYGWFDTGTTYENQISSSGYFTTCLETEAGGSWVKLLNTDQNGVIDIQESTTVKIGLNASLVRLNKNNKAYLVVTSNDPNKPVVNYPITLDKNAAPEYTTPNNLIYVKEGETSKVTVSATDFDGDSFTLKLNDESGIAKLTNATAANGSDVTVTITDGNVVNIESNNEQAAIVNIEVTFTPEYGKSGLYSFNLEATDNKDNSSSANVKYYVEHVNRAPVAIEQSTIEIAVNETSGIINFSSMFNDPDGDEMTYSLNLSETGIVELYTTAESVIFAGLKAGTVVATVTATDANGLSTQNIFNIAVAVGTGIENTTVKGKISIYPNPVVDQANVTVNSEVYDVVTYKVYNTNATLMHRESASKNSGETHAIDMSSFVPGIYYLEVEFDGESVSLPIIKK